MTSLEELSVGFEYIETRRDLSARFAENRPLRIKLGLDPTTPDLHLGHSVVLERLQRFIAAGHDVTLVIGDFTTRIGDPSGRNDARPALSDEQISENMKTYAEQAGKMIDLERVHLRYNSTWLAPLTLDGLIRLLSHVTVAQMLKREDFAKRFASNTPISLHEFLYPIAQAYDSVELKADIELGGNDQLFNLLMGRFYQTVFAQAPQICMTVPLLEGLDGTKKMSKSTGNYIAVTDSPQDKFGKTMRIPDELIDRWNHLLFNKPMPATGATVTWDEHRDPMEEKKRLAGAIVAKYHGENAALQARQEFEAVVQRKEAPRESKRFTITAPTRLDALVVTLGFAESKRAAQRLIESGAVRLDGTSLKDVHFVYDKPHALLSVGNRSHAEITLSESGG